LKLKIEDPKKMMMKCPLTGKKVKTEAILIMREVVKWHERGLMQTQEFIEHGLSGNIPKSKFVLS
jgi:hypothetical protein